jgi:putative endonuclease
MNRTRDLGRRGEIAARYYLNNSGYNILANNYRIKHKEIDLIASFRGKIVFIEVKTRNNNEMENCNNQIGYRQLRTLRRAMASYALEKKLNLNSISLDLIVIFYQTGEGRARIVHYRNIV